MEKAGEILKKILDKDSMVKAKNYNSLFNSWYEIVQEPLAAHSRIIDIELNQLLISVDHPGWLQILQFNEKRILKALNEKYPVLTIKALKIKVISGEKHIQKLKYEEEDKNNLIREGQSYQADGLLFENIKDIELKNILINFFNKVVDKKE